MSKNSKIGWTHHTVNLWWGCEHAGPECDNCYAEALDKMRGPLFDDGKTHWGKEATRWLRVEKALGELEKFSRLAKKTGEVQRIFINSMSDLFEDRRDLLTRWTNSMRYVIGVDAVTRWPETE